MTLHYCILSTDTNQAKSFSLADGKLVKTSMANSTRGTFSARTCNTLQEFANTLNSITIKQSLILGGITRLDGTQLQPGEKIALTTKAKPRENAVPRSKDFVKNLSQPGFVLFDLDGNDYGLQDIKSFIPELEPVGAITKPSSSSLIYDKEGNQLIGNKGRHIFIPVQDMADIERVAAVFWGRQWLAGHGHYLISHGIHPMMLERGIYDKSVLGYSERLVFEAKPILNDGLQQLNNQAIVTDGGVLDTRIISDLTPDELSQIHKLKEAAKQKIKPDYEQQLTVKKTAFIATGKTAADWDKIKRRELPLDFELQTIEGIIKAGELGEKQNGLTLRDPFEPDYDGGSLTKAKFYWNDGQPKINSQAHGGVVYTIEQKRQPVRTANFETTSNTLSLSESIEPWLFPDIVKNKKGEIIKVLPTKQNLHTMLNAYGVAVVYDEAAKQQRVMIPGHDTLAHDLHNESCLQQLYDLAAINQIHPAIIDRLPMIMTENTINPVKDWIFSRKWDGLNRFDLLFRSLVVDKDHELLTHEIIKTWLIQCVAALDKAKIGMQLNHRAKPKYELVLVLQGGQGLTKTSWFNQLMPLMLDGELFSNRYIKDGSNLQLDNKDSIKQNISCWINELGELDATFRKSDIAQLKAFCSNQRDILRLPYGKAECCFPRSTSFCASVNDENFLNDATGSRRFGVIKLVSVLEHDVDMQQLWAQAWALYAGGSIWWLEKDVEQAMQIRNEANHQSAPPMKDAMISKFDWACSRDNWTNKMTATEIYQACFDKKPNQKDLNEIKPFAQKMGVLIGATNGCSTYMMPPVLDKYSQSGSYYQQLRELSGVC